LSIQAQVGTFQIADGINGNPVYEFTGADVPGSITLATIAADLYIRSIVIQIDTAFGSDNLASISDANGEMLTSDENNLQQVGTYKKTDFKIYKTQQSLTLNLTGTTGTGAGRVILDIAKIL